ncbi:MAG TPA: dihydrolipoamide acetyltransferase family protein [Nocardioides sp.]|nr:dihydrolipoamide acetyltransferase family protein [Nocardioides sp.]
MARVLRMPGVAANATDAVLSEWLVDESGEFGAADPIATVETEKAAVDIEADAAGRVLKTLVPPGAQVEVGDPIAVLADLGEQVDDIDALLRSLGVEPATDVVIPERRDVPADPESAAPVIEEVEMPAQPDPRSPAAANGRVFASPLARKIAKEAGLTIEEITGTGPRGRILRRDVENAVAQRSPVTPPPVVEERAARNHLASYDEIPHSRIRQATARRLTESQQQVPHFYLRATVRAEALLALREEVNADAPVKVSLNDLLVKAVGAAHQRVPEMNVTWTSDAVRRYRTVDVAVAVATDRGLLTPVVRDVGALTVTALAGSVRELAERARDGKLKQDELEGGSISVTNLGMHGVEEFAAVINPPHAAILAVGAVRSEPVVEDDAVVPGRVISLTLSVDHRPVDGVVAARWLGVLTALLEHPARILA